MGSQFDNLSRFGDRRLPLCSVQCIRQIEVVFTAYRVEPIEQVRDLRRIEPRQRYVEVRNLRQPGEQVG
jgi:hypothetical protein